MNRDTGKTMVSRTVDALRGMDRKPRATAGPHDGAFNPFPGPGEHAETRSPDLGDRILQLSG